MRRVIFSAMLFTAASAWALDCPAETAYQLDQDPSSPTYGQMVPTGLCACLGLAEELGATDTTLTISVHVFENEPLRAFQFEIIDNTSDALEVIAAAPGDKIQGWYVPYTETTTGSALVFGFSFAGAETTPGSEGVLVDVTFRVTGPLGDEIAFYLGGEGGVRLADGDAENVACTYPNEANPVTYSLLAVTPGVSLPISFALNQNFPNPFNPVTSISFDLPVASEVELAVFNLIGQKIATLRSEWMVAGRHRVTWNGRDDLGRELSSGVYLYVLKADRFFAQKKMVLLQ